MKSKIIIRTATALAVACSAWLAGCSQREQPVQTAEAPAPAKQPVEKPKATLPSLETLMPKFEVRSNAPNDYRVAFMAHDSTAWKVVDTSLPTREDAQDRYAASSGGWPAMKKTGMYKAVQVRITYKP